MWVARETERASSHLHRIVIAFALVDQVRAEQKGRDTVSDVYLLVDHRSQEPRRSLSSHKPTTDVNATSWPGKV